MPKGLNAKGVARRELRELQGPQAAIFTREASWIVRRASMTVGKWKVSGHGVLRQAENKLIVIPCQAMSMVVVHVASGTRNILVFLGRMAEDMGHALHSSFK
jgi:hypothetical protein